METLDNCLDLIRSHQLYIRWSTLWAIEPATSECKAETLLQNYRSTSGDGKSIYNIIPQIKKKCTTLRYVFWSYNVQLEIIKTLESLVLKKNNFSLEELPSRIGVNGVGEKIRASGTIWWGGRWWWWWWCLFMRAYLSITAIDDQSPAQGYLCFTSR